MVDAVAPITTPQSFDTAAIQLAQAQALAAANQTNELTYLQELANANDASNAGALSTTTDTTTTNDDLLTSDLLNGDIDATANPATLTLFSAFGVDLSGEVTGDATIAQQLHDIGILQQDAQLLEEAALANAHPPLNDNVAATVELSPEAQSIINATTPAPVATTNADTLNATASTTLTTAQLAALTKLLQPVATQPLTPELVQQLQAQISTTQNPITLNLATINLAMNLIAAQELSTNHTINNTTQVNTEVIAPVNAIDKVAVEDSAIR